MMSAQEIMAPGIGPGAMAIKLMLDELLEQKGKSAYWLAREAGLTDVGIHRLRHGRTGAIKFETLEKICRALECEPGDLIKIVPESGKGKRKG